MSAVTRDCSNLLKKFIRTLLILCLIHTQLNWPLHAAAEDLYADGVKLYAARRFQQAIEYFRGSYKAGNQPANSTYYLALCYHQLGNFDDAKATYALVVKQFPNTQAAQNSAKMLSTLGPAVVATSTPSGSQLNWSQIPSNVPVPFRKDPQQGWIIIPVTMNGVTVQMIFDTGAGITTCRQSFLNNNGIKVIETTHHGSLEGAGGEVQSSIVIADIAVGPVRRSVAMAVEQDESYSANGKEMPVSTPLLGQNFFRDIAYTIDDASKTITFKDPVQNAKVVMPDREASYTTDGSTIFIRPKVNGRECDMIFDTGCSLVAFADRHMAACGLVLPPSARSGTSGGLGGLRQAYGFSVDSLQLGPIVKKNTQATVMLDSQFPAPLFGQSFLTGLTYTIDPLRKVIRFD
jgi:clan AA aspartic protease (TIGR02281 family)